MSRIHTIYFCNSRNIYFDDDHHIEKYAYNTYIDIMSYDDENNGNRYCHGKLDFTTLSFSKIKKWFNNINIDIQTPNLYKIEFDYDNVAKNEIVTVVTLVCMHCRDKCTIGLHHEQRHYSVKNKYDSLCYKLENIN